MKRLFTIVASTVVAGLVGSSLPAQAQPGDPRRSGDGPARRVAAAGVGHIEGLVFDERGAPLAGVTVSALGASSVSAVSDRHGSFSLRALPAGSYLVRAQRPGYLPSKRQFVNVAAAGPTRFSLTLQRTGARSDVPGILAAGMVPGSTSEPLSLNPPDDGEGAGGGENRGETAWRLRHLKRSILKEAERAAVVEGGKSLPAGDGMQPNTLSYIARAMGTPAHLLGALPFTGQVNLITSGSFDGAFPALSPSMPLRQVAFLSVTGPAWGHGDWSAQVMAQGDLGSWFVAGSYRRQTPATHVYDVGVSYSTQRFTPGSRWPIAVGSEGTRSAGLVYGIDEWHLSPRARLTYGARYARYDYLPGPGLFSPRVGLTLVPVKGVRLQGVVSRRMVAPGAEEFLEPLVSGLWVPPERSFLGLGPLSPESTNHYEVSLERDLPLHYVLAVRGFYQETANQQVALFGVTSTPSGETGHYVVGNGGDLVARGWSIGLSNMLSPHLRGSVTYSLTAAQWLMGMRSNFGLLLLGPGARPASERLQDLTTALETDIPVTETRVFVAYKLNTGFARRQGDSVPAGLDARFDVQILQRLPFLDFTSAQWQVMLGVRNLFRDTASDASVYDELLVIRPPTRVVTGLLVRF